MSLLVDDYIFVGDTLFNFSIGRTDFPFGDYNTLEKVLGSYMNSLTTQLFIQDMVKKPQLVLKKDITTFSKVNLLFTIKIC